jgi:hypothetical protein
MAYREREHAIEFAQWLISQYRIDPNMEDCYTLGEMYELFLKDQC